MKEPTIDPYEPQEDESYDWDYGEEAQGPRVLWGRIVALVAAMVLIFLLGRLTAPAGDSEQLESARADLQAAQDRLDEAQAEISQLRAEAQATPTPEATAGGSGETAEEEDGGAVAEGETYEVQSGDTLQTIAEDEYGDVGLYTCIADANGLTVDSNILPGEELTLPPEGEC